ncbi:hypothetical protein [Streptomyces sp. NPDC093111]
MSTATATELFRTCARFADGESAENEDEPVMRATRITLRLLAQRIGQLTE